MEGACLLDEDLDKVLIMDWRLESGMNKQERNEVSGLVSELLKRELKPLHEKLAAVPSEIKATPSLLSTHPILSSLVIAVLGSAVGGFFVATWQSHSSRDDERLTLPPESLPFGGYNGYVPRFGVPAALALAAQTPFFPLKDVRPGMRGVGRTVFSGDRFFLRLAPEGATIRICSGE